MKVIMKKKILILIISFIAFKPLIAMECLNNNNTSPARIIPSLMQLCSTAVVGRLQELDALASKHLEPLNRIPTLLQAIKSVSQRFLLNAGLPKQQLQDHQDAVSLVALSHGYLASASEDNTVYLYALDNLKLSDYYLHKEVSIEQMLIALMALKSEQALNVDKYPSMKSILEDNKELYALLQKAKLITHSDMSTVSSSK